MFALEQHCKEKQTIIDSNESCTSKPCKWSVPRKRKGPVQPIKQINVVKHDYAKPNKRPKLETKHSTPPKVWQSDKVEKVFEMMKAYQKKSGNIVSWTHI